MLTLGIEKLVYTFHIFNLKENFLILQVVDLYFDHTSVNMDLKDE